MENLQAPMVCVLYLSNSIAICTSTMPNGVIHSQCPIQVTVTGKCMCIDTSSGKSNYGALSLAYCSVV